MELPVLRYSCFLLFGVGSTPGNVSADEILDIAVFVRFFFQTLQNIRFGIVKYLYNKSGNVLGFISCLWAAEAVLDLLSAR